MLVLFASALAGRAGPVALRYYRCIGNSGSDRGVIGRSFNAQPRLIPTDLAASPRTWPRTDAKSRHCRASGNARLPVDASQPLGAATAPDSEPPAEDNSEVARYQEEQSGMPPEQLKALQEFDSEGELTTPFGMQLREAKRSLKSGEDADGLLITAVAKGSPAAAAGLRPYSHTVHDAIAAAALVGAVFSGGLSVVVIPAIDYMQVGESYDMIIGVDGSRVTNFLDFQDRMRNLQPGEIRLL